MNSETALPYLDMSRLLRNGSFPLWFIDTMSRDKSIQTLQIHQFAGITAKTGENFAVDEAVGRED